MKKNFPDFCRMALILVLPILLFSGCYDSSDSSARYHGITIKDRQEAEVIALCLSGAMTAPDSLTDRVLEDLAEIRSCYGAELAQMTPDSDCPLPDSMIRFEAPWVPGCTLVAFDSATVQLVKNGQYHAWDELNRQYRLSEIDQTLISLGWVELNFKGSLHPRRLTELYMTLPGVRNAHPNSSGGGCYWIYPSWRAGSQLTYLFRHGWGDCPAGCIYNEFWYFITLESGEAIYKGYWNPEKDPSRPDWWTDAYLNYEQYRLF